jgi:hypothetical protein
MINCNVSGTTPLMGDTLMTLVRQLLQGNLGDTQLALQEVETFFADFDTPDNSYSHTTLDVVRRALELGIACQRCLNEIPAALQRRLEIYRNKTVHEVRQLLGQRPFPLSEEVFEDDHGLKSAPQSHRDYVKGKVILDVGAWVGDSAVALAKYAARVYSFELSPGAFEGMVRNLREVGNYTKNVVPILAGMGETESLVYVAPGRFFAQLTEKERGGYRSD